MAFKPIDPKRDEFRRYLEHGGVIEALTKLFVRLIKERPENPIEYLHNNLGDFRLQADHEAFVRTELEEAKAEIQRLRSIIMTLDPTALEDTKESDLVEAIPENLEETAQAESSQTEPENSIVHTEVESVVINETVVTAEVAPQVPGPENSEKDDNNADVPSKLEEKIDETPEKLEEKVNETTAKLEDKNNEVSPQTDNKTNEVSAELSATIVEAVVQSNDNNADAATKSSDDNKAGHIPQFEDKHINKDTK